MTRQQQKQHPEEQPDAYNTMPTEQQQALQHWIADTIRPATAVYKRRTSAGLMQLFEQTTNGFHVSNGQFKGAMLAAGYQPVDHTALNWLFHIRLTADDTAISDADQEIQGGRDGTSD